MVEVRKFDLLKDYVTLQKWWNEYGSFAPIPDHLPPTGVIVEIEEKPVCAGFLYNTDAKICVMEFLICDPQINKENRDLGLNRLIEVLRDLAISRGYTAIYSSTGIPKFIGRLKEQGFVEADKNQTHMLYFTYETVED